MPWFSDWISARYYQIYGLHFFINMKYTPGQFSQYSGLKQKTFLRIYISINFHTFAPLYTWSYYAPRNIISLATNRNFHETNRKFLYQIFNVQLPLNLIVLIIRSNSLYGLILWWINTMSLFVYSATVFIENGQPRSNSTVRYSNI